MVGRDVGELAGLSLEELAQRVQDESPEKLDELRRAVLASTPDVVLVEPYLRGTSAHLVDQALADLPHRVLALGVRRDVEIRAYGTADEHEDAHGLGPTSIAAALRQFLNQS